jgi:hypothetical protein
VSGRPAERWGYGKVGISIILLVPYTIGMSSYQVPSLTGDYTVEISGQYFGITDYVSDTRPAEVDVTRVELGPFGSYCVPVSAWHGLLLATGITVVFVSIIVWPWPRSRWRGRRCTPPAR